MYNMAPERVVIGHRGYSWYIWCVGVTQVRLGRENICLVPSVHIPPIFRVISQPLQAWMMSELNHYIMGQPISCVNTLTRTRVWEGGSCIYIFEILNLVKFILISSNIYYEISHQYYITIWIWFDLIYYLVFF